MMEYCRSSNIRGDLIFEGGLIRVFNNLEKISITVSMVSAIGQISIMENGRYCDVSDWNRSANY